MRLYIGRFVYSFLNPVRAGLVRSIDHYQGCNTWKEFLAAPADLHAVIEKEVPWILATDIEPLSQSNPSHSEERRFITELKEKASARQTHTPGYTHSGGLKRLESPTQRRLSA